MSRDSGTICISKHPALAFLHSPEGKRQGEVPAQAIKGTYKHIKPLCPSVQTQRPRVPARSKLGSQPHPLAVVSAAPAGEKQAERLGLSAEPRGGWVSLLGPWPRSQKGQRDKVFASWHQVTAPTQGPGFQASLPGRESCRSAGSRQSPRPILEAAVRTKRLWHRPLAEGAEREPHRPVRPQPCQAAQAADRGPDSRSPGETAPGLGKGSRGAMTRQQEGPTVAAAWHGPQKPSASPSFTTQGWEVPYAPWFPR